VLGGAQSVHIDGYDEALCTPTELSSLTALRTNQILQLETRVTHTIDPLGGSYFVETLTNKMEEETLRLLDEIDGMEELSRQWKPDGYITRSPIPPMNTNRQLSRAKCRLWG